MSSDVVFEKSRELSKKKDEYKFFFYGLITTIIATTLVQILLLPISASGLKYYYNGTLIFTTPINSIGWVIAAFIVIILLLYFVVYKKIVPELMNTPFTNQKIIDLSVAQEDDKLYLFREFGEIITGTANMKGLRASDGTGNSWEISGVFPSEINVTVKWDDTENQLVLRWVNDVQGIAVAEHLYGLFMSKIQERLSSKLPPQRPEAK